MSRTALLMVLCGVAGCSNAVAVAVPQPPADIRAVCERLAAALPTEVEGQARRDTNPSSPLTAVWGDPPIALRCGVPRVVLPSPATPEAGHEGHAGAGPEAAADATAETDEQAVGVNGVDWLLDNQEDPEQDGYVFTTHGRVVDIEVHVPKAYAPEVNPLLDLAEPIEREVPLLSR